MGINKEGKIEIVSLEPKEERCILPQKFPVKSSGFQLKDLDGSLHLYDGNLGMHLLHKNGTWDHVTDLPRKIEKEGNLK